MQRRSATPPPQRQRSAALARAEARGRQVLLYAPEGLLGGSFVCSRCGAGGLQPDLLTHAGDCPYGAASSTSSTPPPPVTLR